MSETIITPERLFKMGSVELADPDPSLPPDEAVRLYAPNYPHLLNATLSDEPEIREDGTIVYEIQKNEVKTKG